jgi:methionyl aminopeptidase
MKKSGEILGTVLYELKNTIRAGQSTLEIDQLAETIIHDLGGHPTFKGYQGFPASICISINEEVVHGIPSADRIIQEGDMVTIDCGVTYNGMITDSAITVSIGKATPQAQKLLQTATKALDKAISLARPGLRTTELSKAIESVVRKEGFGIVENLSGHGVGFSLHEDPYILNFYNQEPGPVMQTGMTFAIEPIITLGSPRTKTLKDGWTIVTKDGSLAVQVEHTIAITEKGAEILTKQPK